jgi:aconitate hydratase
MLKSVAGVKYPIIELPRRFVIDDSMIDEPLSAEQAKKAEVIRGSTIVVPQGPQRLGDKLVGKVLLKCGDKITTDDIMPAGAFLKHRSNVPEYAKVVFNCFNEAGKATFAERAFALKVEGIGGIVVAGQSYGQGSSREHAALCPMYLGVRAVIAKSIERIHKANLINFAIVPVEFADASDYDRIGADDELEIGNLRGSIEQADEISIIDKTGGFEFSGVLRLSRRAREILLAGGLLEYIGSGAAK